MVGGSRRIEGMTQTLQIPRRAASRMVSAPLGAVASVSVTVTCTVDFGVGLPGFPTTRTLSATKTSPVDTYRSRR